MAGDGQGFEFQRLHGMGAALHAAVQKAHGTRHRVYAPVGTHRDLLAYLVRRLLENGANSSFVAQVTDHAVTPEKVAADPFDAPPGPRLPLPAEIFGARRNSPGTDPGDPEDQAALDRQREPFRETRWVTGPILAAPLPPLPAKPTRNPATGDVTGEVSEADAACAEAALAAAETWQARPDARAAVLEKAADLLLSGAGEVCALLAREAGKTLADAEGELREAVDFLRYYAAEARRLRPGPRGVFTCIAPWNFPLAIFAGQVAAALASGNAVLAKPAPQTPHIAALAVRVLHRAGVPAAALQFLPGGSAAAARLTGDPRLAGVAFTGSTATALAIRRAMAASGNPAGVLIAETGGINAMVVDSTALPEQAVRDIVASAFRSAGQRCSALRLLCLQEDIAEPFLTMLKGAMAELRGGDPWQRSSDYGPLIDEAAWSRVRAHVDAARSRGQVLAEGTAPDHGFFQAPALLALPGARDLEAEIFGPVLHVVTWAEGELDRLIDQINAKGYGLTFGLHTRIDRRVAEVSARIRAGNVYVNRNQIGAVVGSQPFGGEGLSGTGPKAGGPHYVSAFSAGPRREFSAVPGAAVAGGAVQTALESLQVPDLPAATLSMPGPTGESNRLSLLPRGIGLALGPGREAALSQKMELEASGCPALAVAPGLDPGEGLDGILPPELLAQLTGFAFVVMEAGDAALRPYVQALAARSGPIIPLLPELAPWRLLRERHLCVDTTAAGGNAALMAGGTVAGA
jgi:RHH-type proline utilization regulon transcriptional repressor/proline dehydrogenase/delta 1-pyrroline-5-carboxylate dehydrogenase